MSRQYEYLEREKVRNVLGDIQVLDSIGVVFSIVTSVLALALAGVTTWLTLLRRGKVKMTRPTMVAFVQDSEEQVHNIVLRALLYCTADRGRVIENMYANLRHKTTTTTFAFWGYGETNLSRGGGLFIGREGVAVNHHFVLLSKSTKYKYEAGDYTVEFFAEMVGEDQPHKLAEATVSLTEEMAQVLTNKTGGVMFNWNPNNRVYKADIQHRKVDLSGVIGPTGRIA